MPDEEARSALPDARENVPVGLLCVRIDHANG